MAVLESLRQQGFFRNKDGRLAIWLWPNAALWGWAAFKALSLITNSQLSSGLEHISTALLFTWAFLEITGGSSYFRRLLGMGVMAWIIVSFFS